MTDSVMAHFWIGALSLTVLLRLLPHLPNFAPVGAFALFAGFALPWRGLFLPIAALFASDFFIGFYDVGVMASVYGSFALLSFLGRFLRGGSSFRLFPASVFGSLLFYGVTNGAVWAFTPWYPKTGAGLLEAYVLGLPFLRNTMVGDLFYIGVFVGAYAFMKYAVFHRGIAYGTAH